MSAITHIAVHPIRGRGEHAIGLKCQLFEHDLTGLDIFTGPNGTGKTTRILAIVCAALGIASTPTDPRRPYLETIPADTGVTVTAEHGGFTRELDANPRTKIAKEADETASKILGYLPVAWNLSDWARSTRSQRANVLDTIARAGGVIESWDAPRAQREARITAGARWPDLCIEALPTADDGAEWLNAAITWTEHQLTQAGRTAKAAIGAAAAASIDTKRPGGEADDRASREALIEERARLRRAGSERQQAQQALERHQQRGEGLRVDIARLTEEGKRLGVAEVKPAEQRNPALVAAVETARGALEAAEAALVDCAPLVLAHQQARDQHDEARRAVASANGQITALEAVSNDAECVHCHEGDPLGIGPRLEAARAALVEAQASQADAHAAEAVASGNLDDGRELERAHRSAQRQLGAAERALTAEGTGYEQRVTAWENRERTREHALGQARQRYAALKTQIKTWEDSEPPAVPEDIDHSQRISEIASELEDIEARGKDRAEWDVSHRASVEAARKAEIARESHEACKAFLGHLRNVRDTMARKAYKPIEDAARQLVQQEGLDAVLPVPYFRGPDCYGADCGYGEVPYSDLSQSQQLITAACFVYALAVVSAQPVRLVMLDGLEVVQLSSRAALLRALAAARARGDVNNVIATLALELELEDEPEDKRQERIARELPTVEGVVYHRLTEQQRRQPVEEPHQLEPAEQALEPLPTEPTPIESAPVAVDDCPF